VFTLRPGQITFLRPAASIVAWIWGSDHQRAVRTGERDAERFDGAPIDFAVFLEFREVVDECGVNHAIGRGRSATQTCEILQISPMYFRTSGDERFGAGIRASEAEHLNGPL